MRRRVTTPMATCCPARKAVVVENGRAYCKLHLPRTLALLRAPDAVPVACPHCHADEPMWQRGADFCHCVACGTLWERPMAVIGTR